MSQVLPPSTPMTATTATTTSTNSLTNAHAAAAGVAATARVKAGIDPWTVDDAADLYNLRGWGKGFFEISKSGEVLVRPTRTPGREVNLFDVVKGLRERGLRTPVLLHFTDHIGASSLEDVVLLDDEFFNRWS